jgi:predicted RND superfamily exporter protein
LRSPNGSDCRTPITVFQTINNDLVTFVGVCKNLFIAALLSVGIVLGFSYLLCYFPSEKEVDWRKENFKFTYESFNKLIKKLGYIIIVIVLVIGLLITNGNRKTKYDALNIYNKLFEEDSSYSDDYLFIGPNGHVKYAVQKKNGAEYTVYEYMCTIKEGDERKLEKYGSFYKYYNFSCEYESDEFTFRISASYEKSRTNRYTIYKDESKEYIPGSTGTFGDGFKESLSEFSFDEYK